jgi:hypothetical protein
MVNNGLFSRSRSFLYLGIALVGLALVTFPMRIPIQAQPMDVDYYSMGWLFAPIIGMWGLASTVLGLVEMSWPKRRIESYLIPILAIVSVGLAYAAYLAIVFGSGIIRSVGRGEPFFLALLQPDSGSKLVDFRVDDKILQSGGNSEIFG